VKTIQLSERELSMIFSMLTPPYPVRDTHTDEFNELRNKVFYALRDAQNDEPVSNRDELPEEKGASLQLRNLIRQRHAEWSDATFGDVGPVGPLKHLSKEALEAAAEPGDLSEWADMQFLLWDAQRRAGICDGEITAAMEEKLKVNMARQWPEPKDGEPRLHIKEAGNSLVIPDCWCHTCRPVTMGDMRFVVCPECGNKRCPHANDHRNACTGSNKPGQVDSAYPAAPQQEVK
ncbi:hypothetical protein AN2353V1_1726, partial [Citrobacter koseri]